MADDFVLSVRQVGQYPLATSINGADGDVMLMQKNGIGGPYQALSPTVLFATGLANGGWLQLAPISPGAPTGGIAFNGASLTFDGSFLFSENIAVPNVIAENLFVGQDAVATQVWVTQLFDTLVLENQVFTFNGRSGNVILTTDDVRRAGAVPQINPTFAGIVTAPTIWNYADASDTVATTQFVQCAIQSQVERGCIVGSVNGRGGNVVLTPDDISIALNTPGTTGYGTARTPPSGDTSSKIATTMFVDDAMFGLAQQVEQNTLAITAIELQNYAPLNSPQFTGIPTAPTAAQTVNSGQLATTAFVHAAVTASTTGVSSWNGRTGAVTLTVADVSNLATFAPLASPALTGNPTATTQAPGDNSTRLATTAFVEAAVTASTGGVSSFNTRTGAVVLQAADVTGVGGALLASPAFSGTPTAPTPTPADNTTKIATTAFVTNAIAAVPAAVSSWNGRTGAVSFQASDVSAVGGALLASPAFTGVPTSTTPAPGDNSVKIATTAFVDAAIAASIGGVASFNGRTGAVTLTAADVTGVGGALLASPTFTGVPAAPTATAGTNSGQIATTAFVQAALSAAPGGVSSFNGRTGAITFLASDISAVGGALLNSPSFSGVPDAPTATPGTNNTQIATTAFVANAITTAGGVNTFNGRAGAVTFLQSDILGVTGGALFTVSDTAPTGALATGNQALWWDGVHGQLMVSYNNGTSTQWVIANSPQPGTTGPLKIQTFLASGTYTPTSGMNHCIIEVVGGGASGMPGVGAASLSTGYAGGGAGGYSRRLCTAAQIGASQPVTVGAGGALSASVSNAGTASSVGSLCIANGAPAGVNACGGNRGASTTGAVGDVVMAGASGQAGFGGNYSGTVCSGGNGGEGPFGGSGPGGTTAGSSGSFQGQPAAANSGAGGGGVAVYNYAGASAAGGAGGSGIVIITEFA